MLICVIQLFSISLNYEGKVHAEDSIALNLTNADETLGGFCGYRNIQMLASYVVGARVEGAERFSNSIPSIFQIQDYVENAWDMGINASGRIETGGIKGTRKYIGTPEVRP
jgi:hypothetical protein